MKEKLVQIEVEKIKFEVHDLRVGYEGQEFDDLVASIGRIGLLVPLVVIAAGDTFHLVAGHRRIRACKRLGLERVNCIVKDAGEAQIKEISLAENIFRKDLSPVETASAINDVLKAETMTVEEIARAMHRSENWIAAQVGMMQWPGDVLEVLHGRYISVSAAANLAMVEDDVYRDFLLRNAVENGATARTTAAWLQAWRALQPVEQALEAEPLPAGRLTVPAVPQAPCLACGNVMRTDQLSHVPICPGCIQAIRNAGL